MRQADAGIAAVAMAAITAGAGIVPKGAAAASLANGSANAATTTGELFFLPVVGLPYRTNVTTEDMVLMTVLTGFAMFAVLTALLLIRNGRRGRAANIKARSEIALLRADLDRTEQLLFDEAQFLIIWGAGDPEIRGDVSIVVPAAAPRRVLAFGGWLEPSQAQALERAVEALRQRGERFSMRLTTTTGRHLDAEGRPIGGRAVLRVRDVTGIERQLADLSLRHTRLQDDVAGMRGLIDALPAPIWMRDANERLVFVNPAYARAVDARDPQDAVTRAAELLDRRLREDVVARRQSGEAYRARLALVAAGSRRPFEITDVPARQGSAGIALDMSAEETARAELQRAIAANRRTLDHLSIGVAIFSANGRLVFYNNAYRQLWDLDVAFLDSGPPDSVVLDQLRAMRKLPEPRDYRQWKQQLHEAYRALEPRNQEPWHLPDGRTLRVVTLPESAGGVIYLFEDISQHLDLERRFSTLIRTQRETLDHLADGVVVFGSDGRVNLHNPEVASLWRIDAAMLDGRPHIDTLIPAFGQLLDTPEQLAELKGVVTGLDRRDTVRKRLVLATGAVLESAAVPLPDGATLWRFNDVTASVNVERALTERADALEAAARVKNDFVQHVSYVLRTPLTSIIGFAQLLDDGVAGAPTLHQREYLGHITTSSAALLAIIDDILDLASIDAGAMELDLAPVDVREATAAAIDGLADRIADKRLRVDVSIATDTGAFVADAKRVRQVLFNVLANAIAFSGEGEMIDLTARRDADDLVFAVTDRGPGIPADMLPRVFERFEARARGADTRGAGLGLSIVRAFVELHGGSVAVHSAPGTGTTVTCRFPARSAAQTALTAAE
jgi:signal transduction histidine kinase